MRQSLQEVVVSNAVASLCKTSEALTEQWLALALTPGLGPTKARRLVEFFGGIGGVFAASLTELEASGVHASSAQSLATGRSIELAHNEIIRAAAAGARLVSLEDPIYPGQLKQIYDPPLVLYVRGNESVISEPGIAVVGTRHPTPYGLGMAERLACDLAAR
jgi:DNA processing protein